MNALLSLPALNHPASLQGRYRLVRTVGQGGFGVVYEAEDLRDGKSVAIKETQPVLGHSHWQERAQAAQHEGNLLADLHHSGIPCLYEQFSLRGRWYLVMEYIDGVTLEEYLQDRGGSLPISEVLCIGLKLCNILHYLHSQQPPIVFCDLNPSNIMLTPDQRLVLVDFGIAARYLAGKATQQRAYGTLGYAAPERYPDEQGDCRFSPQSDLYSLGVILHQLLTGNDPQRQPKRFHFAPLTMTHCSQNMSQLIQRLLSIDAANRPVSISEVRRHMQSLAL
jgi:serine/threonine protein kinase